MVKKIKKIEKELIKRLTSFWPNRIIVKKKVNPFPFLGMIAGFIFGVIYLFYFWDKVFNITSHYFYDPWLFRFQAMGASAFLIITTMVGIIVGKAAELLVRKLKD